MAPKMNPTLCNAYREPFRRPVLARVLGFLAFLLAAPLSAAANASLVIVIDGLRADYVTPELMPNLHALGETGLVGEAHHAAFPSVTRVNAASIATGAYPGAHGLMHNAIYLPGFSEPMVDTTHAAPLMRVESEMEGGLLTAPSIGELLAAAGKKVFVISSGSTGSAFLLNHKLAGAGVLNSRGFSEPASLLARAEEVVGARYRQAGWLVEAYLEVGLKEVEPDVTLMWITDPDGAGHLSGVGSPRVIEALREVDDAIGRLLAGLEALGLRERTNIFVTADHGFSTHLGPFDLTKLLAEHGLDDGVVIVGGRQIYVRKGGGEKIRRIVRVLQKTEWVGAIFTRGTRPGDPEGFVPGTLSLEFIHNDHPRAADILVDPAWSDAVNEYGYAGATTAFSAAGHPAGHGGASPYDLTIRLIAAGPDIKLGVKSQVPTSNADLIPTLCYLHGLTPAPTMMGRVLKEVLRDGPDPDSVPVEYRVERVASDEPGVRYSLELHRAHAAGSVYIQSVRTVR